MPRRSDIDGDKYSVKPSVTSGSFDVANENRPIGAAVKMPQRDSKMIFFVSIFPASPVQVNSACRITIKAIGTKIAVS